MCSSCNYFARCRFHWKRYSFFWRQKDKVFIVSNWHVFSGRRADNRQPVHSDGALPDGFRIQLLIGDRYKESELSVKINRKNKNFWSQHALFGERVDVALMCLTDHPDFGRAILRKLIRKINCLNDIGFTSNMSTQIGQDLFVIGFPRNLRRTGPLPLWKRASIASEPAYSIGSLPSYLIDTATREGMSGSPVIQMANAFIDNTGNMAIGQRKSIKFEGIYSGRHTAGDFEAQLGIVWHSNLVSEIINNPAEGNNDF